MFRSRLSVRLGINGCLVQSSLGPPFSSLTALCKQLNTNVHPSDTGVNGSWPSTTRLHQKKGLWQQLVYAPQGVKIIQGCISP